MKGLGEHVTVGGYLENHERSVYLHLHRGQADVMREYTPAERCNQPVK